MPMPNKDDLVDINTLIGSHINAEDIQYTRLSDMFKDYEMTVSYQGGVDTCMFQRMLYRCVMNTTGPWNPLAWEAIGSGGETLPGTPPPENWVIYERVTFHLETSGDDTTGNGTSAAPWYSLHKVMEYISKYRIILDGQVIIELGPGNYMYSTPLVIDHPDSARIKITKSAASSSAWQPGERDTSAWSRQRLLSETSGTGTAWYEKSTNLYFQPPAGTCGITISGRNAAPVIKLIALFQNYGGAGGEDNPLIRVTKGAMVVLERLMLDGDIVSGGLIGGYRGIVVDSGASMIVEDDVTVMNFTQECLYLESSGLIYNVDGTGGITARGSKSASGIKLSSGSSCIGLDFKSYRHYGDGIQLDAATYSVVWNPVCAYNGGNGFNLTNGAKLLPWNIGRLVAAEAWNNTLHGFRCINSKLMEGPSLVAGNGKHGIYAIGSYINEDDPYFAEVYNNGLAGVRCNRGSMVCVYDPAITWISDSTSTFIRTEIPI